MELPYVNWELYWSCHICNMLTGSCTGVHVLTGSCAGVHIFNVLTGSCTGSIYST